ncbi:GntR family transcriptional regulator, partial [Klebsiella pneumoniae]
MSFYIPDLIPKQKGMTRVQQLVHTFMHSFKDGRIRPGDKLPSVRLCAISYELSPSTIVAAFDVLRDEGVIEAQRGSGFYLAKHFSSFEKNDESHENRFANKVKLELPVDDAWLLANVFRAGNNEPSEFHSFGGGWLPENWYAQKEILKALRDTSRNDHT